MQEEKNMLDKIRCVMLLLGKKADGTDKNFLCAWYKSAAAAVKVPSCWLVKKAEAMAFYKLMAALMLLHNTPGENDKHS